MISRRDLHKAWRVRDAEIRRGFRPTPFSIGFDDRKILRGVLKLPANAASIVFDAQRIDFTWDATTPRYHTSSFHEDKAIEVRASSHFRAISGALRDLLAECVTQLREPVAAALGTPWQIVNTRAWVTPPIAANTGMYNFHRDGFPWQIFKAMIYFTPMDAEHGRLEFRSECGDYALDGPAGSWVLFFNSQLVHRGLPGMSHERACAELTIVRATEFNPHLVDAGANAHWPYA